MSIQAHSGSSMSRAVYRFQRQPSLPDIPTAVELGRTPED